MITTSTQCTKADLRLVKTNVNTPSGWSSRPQESGKQVSLVRLGFMLQATVVKFETVTCLVAGNRTEQMSNTLSRSIYLIKILRDFLIQVTDIIEFCLVKLYSSHSGIFHDRIWSEIIRYSELSIQYIQNVKEMYSQGNSSKGRGISL